ncbi:hypothetical protein [Caballeronia cordobensis]|uniref:hypothetical protein n=1 Tax=Caballeronia cordobensis TaxID=1353886 RepID=UPI00045EE1B2|nr:hypothetical protein BRPE67_BCDS06150 [Burkholderia sp. RPE67]
MSTLLGYILFFVFVASGISVLVLLVDSHQGIWIEDEEDEQRKLNRKPWAFYLLATLTGASGLMLLLAKPHF